MVPVPGQDENEETSSLHSYLLAQAPPSRDIVESTLAMLEQHHKQQQDPKTSIYIEPEDAGRHSLNERDFPSTPKSLRSSLLDPVLVSPAVSDTSQDSLDDGDCFWDTPILDGENRSGMANIDTLTPLTPPSTSIRVRLASFGDEESPLLKKTRRQTQFITDAVLESKLHDRNVKCDAETVDRDYFSLPQQKIFRVTTLLEKIKKSQPRERFLSKPDTDFSSPHKMTTRKMKLESTVIKKNAISNNALHTTVISEQSSTIKVEEARSTDRSAARSTSSTTIETKTSSSRKAYSPIFPFDVHTRLKISTQLKNSTSLCVSFTKKGIRCGHLVRGSALVQYSLEALKTHYNHRNYKEFLAELKTFIRQALCGRSHREPAINRMKTLENTNRGSTAKEKCRESLVNLFGTEDADVFCFWAKATSDLQDSQTQEVLVDEHESSADTHSVSNTVTTEAKSYTAWSAGPISTSVSSTTKLSVTNTTWFRGFHPYQPKSTQGLSPSVTLKKVVEAKLTDSDLKSGYIYIFWLKGLSFGHLKIGRSVDPQKRIKQWDKQCKHEHVFVQAKIQVPHVSRVEKLIHRELKDIRKSMKCAGCKKVHQEWFEISENNAERVLKKWQDWIMQHPYGKDHTGEWTLKSSSRTTIEDICQPLLLDPKPVSPVGSKKYKAPKRKVSKAHSPQIFANRDDNFAEPISDDKGHHAKSAKLRTSNRRPKTERSGHTSAQASSCLPSKGGNDDTKRTRAATTFNDLNSQLGTDSHTTESQSGVNMSSPPGKTENTEKETAECGNGNSS